ncbi:MAG: hypothetical protein O7D29_00545 [Gemmatimonadetes bacterium]|nr:hypothetical protein [Gemmatimonadota bacterium]
MNELTIPEPAVLATVAGIIAGIGSAMLLFRLQRELHMAKEGESIWIPWADRLLGAATLIALLAVLLPLVSGLPPEPWRTRLASAFCTVAVLLVAGYIPAALAHYRLLFGASRSGPRSNPEPGERGITWFFVALAAAGFVVVLGRGPSPVWSLIEIPDILIKVTVTVSGLLVVLGSIGMIVFATRFPFSTRIRDLESTPERVCGLNGYQVWKYAWSVIIIGALGQVLASWFK